MPNIGDEERKTQNRVVKFFREKLHYIYLGDLHDVDDNSNVIEAKLTANLEKRGYSSAIAKKAVSMLLDKTSDLSQGLYKANQDVYSLLKYGAKVAENPGDAPKTVYFIDFSDVSKNDFYIAEEVTVHGDHTKRPDIVVYINGVAVAVIQHKHLAYLSNS